MNTRSIPRSTPCLGRPRAAGASALALAAVLAFSGCASAPASSAGRASGPAHASDAHRSSVLMQQAHAPTVVATIVRLRTGGEWSLLDAGDQRVVRTRRLRDMSWAMRFGNAFDREVEQRTVYTVTPTAAGTWVTAESLLVRYPNTVMEQAVADPSADAQALSRDLRLLKTAIERP